MELLREFIRRDNCPYLEGEEEVLHYYHIDECPIEYNQALIEMGYRRFGKYYFRPICPNCNACKSIKIDIERFEWTKSKRRVLRKAKDITVKIQKCSLDERYIELYKKYHLYKQQKSGWEYQSIDLMQYNIGFVEGGYEYGYEVLYYYNKQLIAVDLIDILPMGISSIYFYYDPSFSKYSLGKLSLYYQIIMAKERNLRWIYLGYYVKECPSLAYKGEFTPYLTLQGRPKSYDEVKWR